MRISPAENLRFPEEGSSAQGKPGPKPRPKGVGDGQSVEIPMPPDWQLSEVVTQKDKPSQWWNTVFKHVGGLDRQIRLAKDSEV